MTTYADLSTPPAAVLPVRVYYEDTDAAGVVYYANYLRFCERARTEWLRGCGFSQQELLASRQLVFVVRHVTADYLKPGQLDDQLSVETRIGHVGRASMTFIQSVLRDGERLFEARVVIACVNIEKGKPEPIPADVRSQLHLPPAP